MANFSIGCYYNYKSYSSHFRAMYVGIGDYKLYFSFEHLIAVRDGTNQYITKEKFNYSGKHKDFLKNNRYYYGDSFEVEQDELEVMVFRDLLKIPFDDILRVMFISISSYNGYRSNASKHKAMCVEMGEFKLYYSYRTLIAFETRKDQYIINERYSQTTASHKYSARNYHKNIHRVGQRVLELIVFTTLLKLPFEEAKEIAGFYCKRIHY